MVSGGGQTTEQEQEPLLPWFLKGCYQLMLRGLGPQQQQGTSAQGFFIFYLVETGVMLMCLMLENRIPYRVQCQLENF